MSSQFEILDRAKQSIVALNYFFYLDCFSSRRDLAEIYS